MLYSLAVPELSLKFKIRFSCRNAWSSIQKYTYYGIILNDGGTFLSHFNMPYEQEIEKTIIIDFSVSKRVNNIDALSDNC